MKTKKLLSIVLSLIMVLTLLPVTVYGQEDAAKTDYTDSIKNADLSSEGDWETSGTKGIKDGICKVGTSASFDFCQDITLPAGQYKLTANAAYRYTDSEQAEYEAIQEGTETHFAVLYADTADKKYETTVKNRYEGASDTNYYTDDGVVEVNGKYVPNSSAAVAAWFAAGAYSNELIFNVQTEGTVTIGIAKSAEVTDYTVIGAWNLIRLGDAELSKDEDTTTDYTDHIVNANLSSTDGWDARGTKGIENKMCRVGTGESFNFCQNITLPAGQYKLTAYAAYRYTDSEQSEYDEMQAGTDTHLAALYAETSTYKYQTAVMNRYEGASETNYYPETETEGDPKVVEVNGKYVPNASIAVAAWFAAGKYNNELIFNVQEEGTVTIGIAKTAGVTDYTVIGTWSLFRLKDAEDDPAHIHTEVVIAGKAATCEEEGLTEGLKCETCGEILKEQTSIPALGHDWDEGVITKEATETETGVKTYTCKNNKKHTKTEELPMLPKQEEEVPNPPQDTDTLPDTSTESAAKGTRIETAAAVYVVTVAGEAPEVSFKALLNKKVKSVTIPETIQSENVTYKVTGIEKNAFKGNKVLKTVRISKNIKTIGANAFKGAKKLKKVVIKSTVLKKVEKNAFKGIDKKAVIQIPKSKKKAYKKLLKKKGQASTVQIKA